MISDEQAAQLIEATKLYYRIYVNSETVVELLAARKELAKLRTESTASSTTIDNIEAALGDVRDPNLSLYENVLKLRAKAEMRAVPVAECKMCGGTGVVDDGEITHSGGAPFMSGPVKCVKDCPACTAPPAQAVSVPEGWMRDIDQVEGLASHLEHIGWTADARGDVQCNDQGAAMAAEVIRKVLQPLLAASPSPEPQQHKQSCASLNTLLLSNPPQRAKCDCGAGSPA